MTTAIIETRGLLVASRADRLVRALLLPFGEVGRTNLGRFSVDRGVFALPADPDVVTFNDEHERTAPIGRAVELEETDDGVLATFRIANTPEGDAALDDIESGRRRAVSAEVANVVIRAGKAVAGRLFGAALVVAGAFPSAALLAADVGEDPQAPEADPEAAPAEPTREDTTMPCATCGQVHAAGVTCQAPAPAAQAPEAPAAPAPATLDASLRPNAAPAPRREDRLTITEPSHLFAALAHYHATGNQTVLEHLADARVAGSSDLFAALSHVKYDAAGTDGGNVIAQPEWLGKFWDGSPYVRRVAEHFRGAALTSLKVKGWEWGTKPRVSRWGGNKTAVPSNQPAPKARPDQTAQRFAGAHNIAREYTDFPSPEFWDEYFTAMRDSYVVGSEAYGIETLRTAATAVTRGAIPTSGDRAADPSLVKIVDGALAVNRKGAPSIAVLAEDAWRQFILTPKDNVLAYLSSAAGLSEGQAAGFQILPTPYDEDDTAMLSAGEVLVGTKAAAAFRELPGVPIRVEGLNVSLGGVEPGLFGYALMQVNNAKGLALVTDPAETPAAG
jgi:hypothetical protein